MTNDFIYARSQADFIESVLDTIRQSDGYLLSELLSVTQMSKVDDLDFSGCIEPNLEQQLNNDSEFLWRLLSQHHWFVCRYLQMNDIDRAFRHQSRKFSILVSILNGYSARMTASTFADDLHDPNEVNAFSNDDEPSWLLPVFNRHAHELRLLALPSSDDTNTDDYETSDSTNSNSTIQTCNRQLLQALTVIQRFPSTVRLRKLGIFIIANQTLKTYYALHKFNLCIYSIQKTDRSLKQYMEEERSQSAPRFSSYVVTYRYFLGKHFLLKHNYQLAAEHFDYVFMNCLDSNKSGSIKNKQQSLLYLVVAKMLYGSTPKMNILEKYQLHELIDLIEPVRMGSLNLFIDKVKEYEQFLFDTGLYFLIENLKLVAIRNLFRTYVYQIDQQQTVRIPLESTLLILLNYGFQQEHHFTINELIDILDSMIQKGMIKGYISYKFRTLVVSKKDPFPKHFHFTSLLNSS